MPADIAKSTTEATWLGMNPMPTFFQWSRMTRTRAARMPSGGERERVAASCAAAYDRSAAWNPGHSVPGALPQCAAKPPASP